MNYPLVGSPVVGIRNPNVDRIEAGVYSISGKVKEMGNNIPCRVRLFEKNTGRLIADVETDEDGNYVFKEIIKVLFFIVAHHPKNQFNAVIQDNVVPK